MDMDMDNGHPSNLKPHLPSRSRPDPEEKDKGAGGMYVLSQPNWSHLSLPISGSRDQEADV
jgi:hypothetical protein